MRRLLVRPFIMAAVAAGLAALDERAVEAQVSTLDIHQAQASALFDRRIDALRGVRVELVDDVKKYDRACRGKVTTGRAVGAGLLRSEFVWFAERFEIDNETTPACRMLATGIKTKAQHLTRELAQLDEDARRGGIYPGVMRDMKRKYGFE